MPGITHWNHPGFFAYFAITGSAPGILAEFLSAALNVQAMLWRTSPAATELEEVALGVAAAAARTARRVRGRHLRHGVDLHSARPRRRARARWPRRCATQGLAGRATSPHAGVLLGSGALVDRQGGHPARSRPGVAAKIRERCRSSGCGPRCARRRDRRGPRGRLAAARRRRDRRHHVVHERRPGGADRGGVPARVNLAARRCGVRGRGRDGARVRMDPPGRRTRRFARRQPAQVAVHAVRSLAFSTAGTWMCCAPRSR